MYRLHHRFGSGRRVLTVVLACTSLASACLPTTSEPPGVTPLEGQWDVSGQATTGNSGALQGVLTVQSTSATGFAGSYDVLESATQGQQRRVSGPVAGRMAGVTTMEFDVSLAGLTRRHVGTQAADTLRGSWFDVSANGAVEASGSFRAVRR